MRLATKLTLILILELLLFAPGFSRQTIDRGSKTIDDYWAETELESKELISLLEDGVCYSDKISYLSCFNALNLAAEKLGKVLTIKGQLRDLTVKDLSKKFTEREDLMEWAKRYDENQILREPTFSQIWNKIEKKLLPQQKSAVVAAGINGYLSVAKDPHSYIIPLAYYEEVIAKSDSRAQNLGFVSRRTKNFSVVRRVFESSPADKAGLKKGDRILRINGLEVKRMTPVQYSDLMKGKVGNRLSLLIERYEQGAIKERYLEIIKADFSLPTVQSKILTDRKNLGHLVINKFARDTCMHTQVHIKNLMKLGATGILLDLRDNPGGQVEEASCVINIFVDKGRKIFETRYTDPYHPPDVYVTEDKAIYKGPVAVIVNSGSASSAEIVAGALKDLGRAVLIGERTFGKGTFQDGKIWGTYVKIAVFETSGMFYFPSGWTSQLVGIEPDIPVQFGDVEFNREEDLYYNPLVPKDLWKGPQSLAWLQMMSCSQSSLIWSHFNDNTQEDLPLNKATEWLNCGSNQVGSVE